MLRTGMDAILDALNVGTVQLKIIGEVIFALILGGLIGYDREAADKPAGLRTHMLVCAAAALFVGLGNIILSTFESHVPNETIRSDPIRLYEAIITGVSFLGAGTIIRRGRESHVEGITTAASLLMTSAIGASVGLGQWFLSSVITALLFVVLRVASRLKRTVQEKRLPPTPRNAL